MSWHNDFYNSLISPALVNISTLLLLMSYFSFLSFCFNHTCQGNFYYWYFLQKQTSSIHMPVCFYLSSVLIYFGYFYFALFLVIKLNVYFSLFSITFQLQKKSFNFLSVTKTWIIFTFISYTEFHIFLSRIIKMLILQLFPVAKKIIS